MWREFNKIHVCTCRCSLDGGSFRHIFSIYLTHHSLLYFNKHSTNNSNFHSSEPVTEALIIQTPTVTPLLNSTAVLLSTVPVLIPLIGSIANGLKGNSNLVTPKVSRYKQKRSSDKVLNYEDKLKTSFSPFFLPEKSHPKTELLMNRDNIFLDTT